jgi:hypothetical protein
LETLKITFADDLDQFLCGRGLEQITACAGVQRAFDFHVSFKGRKHHNAACGLSAGPLRRGNDQGQLLLSIGAPSPPSKDLRPVWFSRFTEES